MKLVKIFILVLLVGGPLYFLLPSAPVDECRNVFESEVYSQYHHQRKKYLINHPLYFAVKMAPEGPLTSNVQQLIELLEQPIGFPDYQRKAHEEFVNKLREIAKQQTSSEEQDAYQLYQDLIRWTFLEADLNQTIDEYVSSFIDPQSEQDITTQLLSFRNREPFDGLHETLEIDDGFLHGNLPSVMFTAQNTKVIRMGRPTRQRLGFPWFPPQITPEFTQFIQQKPEHVYVNVTKRHGREGRASKRIEALEKEYSGFYVVTLDRNSSFYLQSDPYDQEKDSERFKQLFLDQMDGKHYYWSVHLDKNTWRKKLAKSIDQVHEEHFSHAPQLSKEERCDFIELTYLSILDILVEEWQPGSLNITCHQGMDRGPSLLVLWMLQKTRTNLRELAPLLLGPPLLIHNRSSYPSRIRRFVSASRRLESGGSQ